jgi:UDP-N-acetylmuramoylalanine--D-glutamate ligase
LDQSPPDLYVLELSSFQLDTTWSLQLTGAVVLNVSADHLDRYASVTQYADSKARIFSRAATLVLNADDARVARMGDAYRDSRKLVTFSVRRSDTDFALLAADGRTWLTRRGERLMDAARLKIQGLHNASNALAALALGEAAGLPAAAMCEALESFPGLPHRSAWVADIAGVRYIDDSKGTNVGATIAAVAGLPGPLLLIAGGEGKGQDFAPLAAAFRDKVRRVVLIGKDAPALEAALAGVCPTERAATLPGAVRAAAAAARAGDTVLLSPACASLDMFRDYNHRGDVFAAAVRARAEGAR